MNEAQTADSSRKRRSVFIWTGLLLAASLLVAALLALPQIPKHPQVELGKQDIPADGVLVLTAEENLAAGSTLRPGDVTLAVTPKQAQALLAAKGRRQLVLTALPRNESPTFEPPYQGESATTSIAGGLLSNRRRVRFLDWARTC